MVFLNKTFVVTGAGNGIGRQVALLLLQKGARVAGLDIKQDGLDETKKLAGVNADKFSAHICNIANKEAVEALPQQILDVHGSIDGLLNVAGIIQPFVVVNDLNYDQIERVMQVNFYGVLYTTKTFLPYLLKNKTESYLANVSSMGGFLPVPGQSIYGASKAAVKLLTEGLYAELLNTNVRVSIIFPGAIATNITKNSGVDTPTVESDKPQKEYSMTTAPKAAEIIVKGIAKNKFRILVGSDAKFMDKWYRYAPKGAVHMISKKMASLLKK